MNAARPVVHVVDDDSSVRTSLTRLLQAAGHEVQAYASPAEFLERAPDGRGGCAVLDLRMPGLTGLELQESLAAKGLSLPIVFLTAHGDVQSSVRAMKAGAVDFLIKPASPKLLLEAVRGALERDEKVRQAQSHERELRLRVERLTPRERQVFVLVAAGMLNKHIASRLGTTLRTIKAHRGSVMRKLEVSSLAELVQLAERLGIADEATGDSGASGESEPDTV